MSEADDPELVEGAAAALFMTVPEASKVLGISSPTLYRWMDEGFLPSVRFGRHRRLRRSDVRDILRDGTGQRDKPAEESYNRAQGKTPSRAAA